ncbi:MAG: DNA topoisomerase IV [Bacteroidota bacterium]
MRHFFLILLIVLVFIRCETPPTRECSKFRTGTFTFTTLVGTVEKTTTFVRTDMMEIDFFEGKQDTSSVRWINDCEYVLKKINPKNKAEEKSIHIKILTTSATSYTFEYNAIGEKTKFRGTAIKKH